MSDEEVDYVDDEDYEDDKKDEELMQNLIKGIEALKQEKPPTPTESPIPEELVPGETLSKETLPKEPQPKEPRPKAHEPSQPKKSIDLDSMSIDELRALLDQVNEARELNSQLQGMLLMKEVKLLAIKRQIAVAKSEPQKCRQKEEQRTELGRYYVQFKAPYFKNTYDFAGYVIVPENQLPVTAQRYETQAGQWNRSALKDLENNVRTYLTGRKLREMMTVKPKTLSEKERIISSYTYLRKNAPMSSLVGPDFDNIMDWCSVASKLRKAYTPNECQKAWNIFLRPDINKKKWTVAEKENLKRVALEHNYQDWDAIALELGTNRNGYQCFHLYVDKIMKLVEGDWSKAEEDFLTKLVKECTYGNKVMWHKVAYFFETRTITQIYRKWTLSCVGKEVVAGAFTEEEDKTIMEMLIVHKGEFSIAQVAKKLNRISSQIRYRFAQLKSSLKHKYGEWSLEEDRTLLNLVEKFGKKSWSKIAEHMPHRGRVQIRHRYTNLRKRLAKNPELSLETLTRFKRPVHAKRKETNLKCLMELTGMEEPSADVNTNEGLETTVQAVEQIIGPDRKRRRREPSEPMADLSPCRYPELDDDGVPSQCGKDEDFIPDIPLSPEIPLLPEEPQLDLLEFRSPLQAPAKNTVNKPGTSKPSTSKSTTRRTSDPNIEPQHWSESDEEEPDPKPKPRSADLHGPIVEYYNMISDFSGELVKPPQSQVPRKRFKEETLNSILKFVPYKYFDAKNAEWSYDADRTDPYYNAVFKTIEKKSDSEEEDNEEDDKVYDDRLLPPCLTNFEGFYNVLVDMGITDEDLETPNGKLEKEMQELYCKDEETVGAVDRWNKRLTGLFAWPAALSGISLEMEEPADVQPDAPGDAQPYALGGVGPSTSKHVGRRGRRKSKHREVKIEVVDDECTRPTNMDLVD